MNSPLLAPALRERFSRSIAEAAVDEIGEEEMPYFRRCIEHGLPVDDRAKEDESELIACALGHPVKRWLVVNDARKIVAVAGLLHQSPIFSSRDEFLKASAEMVNFEHQLRRDLIDLKEINSVMRRVPGHRDLAVFIGNTEAPAEKLKARR